MNTPVVAEDEPVFRKVPRVSRCGFDRLLRRHKWSAFPEQLSTFGARWLTPTLVLPARFAKVSVQFDF